VRLCHPGTRHVAETSRILLFLPILTTGRKCQAGGGGVIASDRIGLARLTGSAVSECSAALACRTGCTIMPAIASAIVSRKGLNGQPPFAGTASRFPE
jgi:hypothetical protein